MRYLKNLRTELQDEADEAAPNSVEARSVELVFEHLTA